MNQFFTDAQPENLDPQHFTFWSPPEDCCVHVGPEQLEVFLPQVPLPIKLNNSSETPSDHVIGEGVYDYLRRFPDCQHNILYARLLRDGYSHFLADLAAHVVMLDAKDVEPAYVLRKLTYLKILRLLEPENAGLLWQLFQGYHGMAMTFTELPQVQRHLLEAMRFGQDLLKIEKNSPSALNLLAEVDILYGDYPSAISKFQRMLPQVEDERLQQQVQMRVESCVATGFPDHPLVDDLEQVGEAMMLYAAQDFSVATAILERLEEDEYFLSEFVSADFFCLLGMCRLKTDDNAGAFAALTQALEIAPDHELAQERLDSI